MLGVDVIVGACSALEVTFCFRREVQTMRVGGKIEFKLGTWSLCSELHAMHVSITNTVALVECKPSLVHSCLLRRPR
jgi:hypothetical protein